MKTSPFNFCLPLIEAFSQEETYAQIINKNITKSLMQPPLAFPFFLTPTLTSNAFFLPHIYISSNSLFLELEQANTEIKE